jgi:hypothetical protein
VAEDAQRLASRVAYALVELLPAADSPAGVASMVAQVLGHGDADETSAAFDLLRETVAKIEESQAGLRGAAKSEAHKRLTRWISELLARGNVTAGQLAEIDAAVRLAASGVAGGTTGVLPRGGTGPILRSRPPGPPVVDDDDDDE